MRVYYYCKYCDGPVGQLQMETLDEERLGFTDLTEQEKKDIISHDQFGNIYIKTVCDNCFDLLNNDSAREVGIGQYYHLH